MSKSVGVLLFILALVAGGFLLLAGNEPEDTATDLALESEETSSTIELTSADDPSITPIEHASFVMTLGEVRIAVDPVGEAARFSAAGTPGLILLTDIHGDHFSTSTLATLVSDTTEIVAPAAVLEQLPEDLAAQTTMLENGGTTLISGITIDAVPMYNLPQTEDAYHVKGRGNGYVLTAGEQRVYIAGDTEDIPEMRELENIDIAFVPMNLPYTMDIQSAADGVLAFAPAVMYPYHYRGPDGLADVEAFAGLVEAENEAIDVRLGDWYPEAN